MKNKIVIKSKDVVITWQDLCNIIKELCIDDLILLNKIMADEVTGRMVGVTEGWAQAKEYVELSRSKVKT